MNLEVLLLLFKGDLNTLEDLRRTIEFKLSV